MKLSHSFQVEYVADPETGFHVLPGSTPQEEALPLDTEEVAKAKARHKALFAAIAERHRQGALVANQG